MGHNSRYQSITWELSQPIDGIDSTFTMVGVWRTSATISNTFLDVPTIKQTQQWIDENAPDKFIIISFDNMFNLSNDALAITPRVSSSQAIGKLQALLALDSIPDIEVLTIEQIPTTEPIFDTLVEIEEIQPQESR